MGLSLPRLLLLLRALEGIQVVHDGLLGRLEVGRLEGGPISRILCLNWLNLIVALHRFEFKFRRLVHAAHVVARTKGFNSQRIIHRLLEVELCLRILPVLLLGRLHLEPLLTVSAWPAVAHHRGVVNWTHLVHSPLNRGDGPELRCVVRCETHRL